MNDGNIWLPLWYRCPEMLPTCSVVLLPVLCIHPKPAVVVSNGGKLWSTLEHVEQERVASTAEVDNLHIQELHGLMPSVLLAVQLLEYVSQARGDTLSHHHHLEPVIRVHS